MATPAKQAAIAELTELFRESGAAVLTEYRGLSVSQLSQLRTSLRANGSYSVVKNTLTQIAAKEAGVTAFDGHLTGRVTGEIVDASAKRKALVDLRNLPPPGAPEELAAVALPLTVAAALACVQGFGRRQLPDWVAWAVLPLVL